MQKWKRAVISLFLILFTAFCAVCQEKDSVVFLGIFSTDADRNMLTMTEDFYYKQLQETKYNTDFKKQNISLEEFLSKKETFYAEYQVRYFFYAIIKKISSSKWEAKLVLKDTESTETATVSKEYESYYKILMESKVNFSAMISRLFKEKSKVDQENGNLTIAQTITTDSISGNWKGEDSINRIVIMRSGRGFVIFKNGASMNVSVKIEFIEEKAAVIVKQTGSNNASFYPELDRKTALESAVEAEPIQWTLYLQSDGTLSGKKKTLVQGNEAVESREIPVVWTKVN